MGFVESTEKEKNSNIDWDSCFIEYIISYNNWLLMLMLILYQFYPSLAISNQLVRFNWDKNPYIFSYIIRRNGNLPFRPKTITNSLSHNNIMVFLHFQNPFSNELKIKEVYFRVKSELRFSKYFFFSIKQVVVEGSYSNHCKILKIFYCLKMLIIIWMKETTRNKIMISIRWKKNIANSINQIEEFCLR